MSSVIMADSLWHSNQRSIYSVSKRRVGIGDVITIYISEASTAVQAASTSTRKDTGITAELKKSWDQISNLIGNENDRQTLKLQLNGKNQYLGSGQTERRSSVKAVITGLVTEILESGNLVVVGEHKVKVNNEVETIQISGVIRPQDISPSNTIFSYQIAKKELSVIGGGVVSSKQTPGFLSRIFGSIF